MQIEDFMYKHEMDAVNFTVGSDMKISASCVNRKQGEAYMSFDGTQIPIAPPHILPDMNDMLFDMAEKLGLQVFEDDK